MNLGFMQNWPKEMGMTEIKTHFVQKIWNGLLDMDYDLYSDYLHPDGLPTQVWSVLETYKKKEYLPKIHTIRYDLNNRWKAGMNIHFVINSRSKNRFQFAPVIPVVSVQVIEISKKTPQTFITGIVILFPREFGGEYIPFEVKVDGVLLNEYEIKILAKNDGFESVEDFFKYFKEDFKGKLIHWTSLRY